MKIFKTNTWACWAGIVTFLLSMWFFAEQNGGNVTATSTISSLVIALIFAFFADVIEYCGG